MLFVKAPLTDAAITEDIVRIHQNTLNNNLIVIIVVAVAALIGLLICYLKYRRSDGDVRKLMISLMAVCVLGGIGAEIFLFDMRQTYTEIADIASDWHVIESTITDLERDEDVHRYRTSSGKRRSRTTVSYYAEFSGISGKVTLTAEQYHSYDIADKVYLVINRAGNIELLYQMDDYEYTGEKLY